MNYLMTGATGYIGKHILAKLLEHGHQVWVIARQKNGSARSRVLEALLPFELKPDQVSEQQLKVLSGDITQYQCGLNGIELQAIATRKMDGFLHCAGLTRFDQHLSEAIHTHNLQGVRLAYETALKLNIAHFHHLSTAFVVGQSDKLFSSADLDLEQTFNNPYEASKFAAEQLLQACSTQNNGHIHIYRPSIVVGGHALGENNTVSTIYTFLKAMHFIRACCRRDLNKGQKKFSSIGVHKQKSGFFIPLRVAASPSATINLVSVNWVTDRVIEGLLNPPSASVQVSSIIGMQDFRLDTIRDAFAEALSISGTELVEETVFQACKRNVFEQRFFRSTRVYLPYLQHSPRFAKDEIANQMTHDPRYTIEPKSIAQSFVDLLDHQQSKTAKGSLNTLALDVLGVKDAHDYFERFINNDLGESFLKRISYVNTRIRFHILSEQAFDRIIHFDLGQVKFETDESAIIDCTYVIDQPLFTEIVKGRMDIRQAFFEGKIKIEGNKEIGLKFGFLFGEHYRNIDDRVIEEISV